jgi:hypothetical protein
MRAPRLRFYRVSITSNCTNVRTIETRILRDHAQLFGHDCSRFVLAAKETIMRIVYPTALIASVALAASIGVAAAQGKDGKGVGGGGGFGAGGWTGTNPPGFDSGGQRKGWDAGTQPPGFAKAQEKGWPNTKQLDSTVPPGWQAK